jgi:hypothetical protein
MGKLKIATIAVVAIALILALTFFLFDYLKPKVAGIYIESYPSATVYIDGMEVGRTPYEKTQKPGEVVIRLIPDSFEFPLAPYETRVNLTAGVKTVINRYFGGTDEASSGEIISFEKIDKRQVSLAVVSIPDSAELLIDGSERAFTPHRTTSISPGTHTIFLKAEGYQERQIDVMTHEGYKLTAVVKLARVEREDGAEAESENAVGGGVEEEGVEKVRILSTPTNFLRVRSEPSTLGQEVGTVDPGEIYELLETDEKTGWFKIKFIHQDSGEEKEGWITNQYAQVLDSETVAE